MNKAGRHTSSCGWNPKILRAGVAFCAAGYGLKQANGTRRGLDPQVSARGKSLPQVMPWEAARAARGCGRRSAAPAVDAGTTTSRRSPAERATVPGRRGSLGTRIILQLDWEEHGPDRCLGPAAWRLVLIRPRDVGLLSNIFWPAR